VSTFPRLRFPWVAAILSCSGNPFFLLVAHLSPSVLILFVIVYRPVQWPNTERPDCFTLPSPPDDFGLLTEGIHLELLIYRLSYPYPDPVSAATLLTTFPADTPLFPPLLQTHSDLSTASVFCLLGEFVSDPFGRQRPPLPCYDRDVELSQNFPPTR